MSMYNLFARHLRHAIGTSAISNLQCNNVLNFRTSAVTLKIAIGDKASVCKAFSPDEVQTFGDICLDKNPIHMDPEFAKTTRFGKPICHGALCVSLLSGVVASKLPGPGTILLSSSVEFPAPLFVGEAVTADVRVRDVTGRKATLDSVCFTKDNRVVAKGVFCVLVPKNVSSGKK